MRKECYYCHIKSKDKLIEKFNVGKNKADELSQAVEIFLQHNWQLSNPLIATHIQRIARKTLNYNDLFVAEKQQANELMLNNYDKWTSLVNKSSNAFQTAAKLAVTGNIIDYGAHSVPKHIDRFIEEHLQKPFAINDSEVFEKAVMQAKSIVYLGDNAGEIVLDKLLIETMQHPNITFAVRQQAVINDVTVNDAKYVGIDKLCKVLPNGSDAPSTLIEFCSKEFIETFEKADLIISKGQGNFEGLMDVKHKNIAFLLMAKCNPIAELLNVEKGSMIIKYNKAQ
jgi:hypothetical protein